MRLLYLYIVLCLSPKAFSQQLLNSDFENWTNHAGSGSFNGYDEADYWASGNAALNAIPNSTAPTTKTTDAQHGTYAAKLTTQKIAGQLAAGNLFTGVFKLNLINPVKSVMFGIPYSDRPTAFNVYYKYTSVNGDSCAIYILLFKYNTVTKTKDTIGRGNFKSHATVSSYTPLTIPITYTSSVIPDSVAMVFTSSAAGDKFKGQVGSSLTVDNFSLNFNVLATIDPLESVHAVLYPNPAQSQIQLSNAPSEEGIVYFYNTSGVLIGSQEWKGTRTPEFLLNNIPAGFYTCKFITREAQVFSGKLLITE